MTHHQEGHLSAPDGTRLWFERDVPDGARAHIVLVHGYGDHLGRYRTFRDAMLSAHLAVHAYDTRGHGRSEGTRGGVGVFSEYTWPVQYAEFGQKSACGPVIIHLRFTGPTLAVAFGAIPASQGIPVLLRY